MNPQPNQNQLQHLSVAAADLSHWHIYLHPSFAYMYVAAMWLFVAVSFGITQSRGACTTCVHTIIPRTSPHLQCGECPIACARATLSTCYSRAKPMPAAVSFRSAHAPYLACIMRVALSRSPTTLTGKLCRAGFRQWRICLQPVCV